LARPGASIVARRQIFVWQEQLLWAVRSDFSVDSAEPLPVIMFESSCPWRERVEEALSHRSLRWNISCEASTLVAMSAAVQMGIGIGPMMAATIPANCRALDRAPNLPPPVDVDNHNLGGVHLSHSPSDHSGLKPVEITVVDGTGQVLQ